MVSFLLVPNVIGSMSSLSQLFEGTLIAGAKQPSYLVTADDVDTYLAIEVQPLDDRKRKVSPIASVWFKQIYIVV